MTPVLNLAIIGCGTVVEELYVLPLRRLAKAGVLRITALIDREPRRMERLGAQLGRPAAHADLASAVEAGKIGAVLVTSPVGLHAHHVVAALGAGCHVFCEKPLTNSSAEAARMIEAAERFQRVLAVGMARRFYPNLAEIAGILRRGELGEPVRFTLREGGPYGWPIATDAAFRRERSGGGVLLDVGAHTIDSLCWLFGEPRVLHCEDDSLRGGVEANVRLQIEFPSASGQVQLSWDQPLNSGLHVAGPRGELRVNNLEIVDYERRQVGGEWQRIRSQFTWPSETRPTTPRRGQPQCYYDCFDYQLTAFFRAILHGEPVAVDGRAAAVVTGAIEASYAIARPMALPWLDAPLRDLLVAGHWRCSIPGNTGPSSVTNPA